MSAPTATLAGHQVLREVGSSQSGRSLLARPAPRLDGLGERVLLKLLDARLAEDAEERVLALLRRMARVDDPHVALPRDAVRVGEVLVTARRWLPAGSLAEGRPEAGAAVRAVADAAVGAHALHEVGVAHRRIAPSNILLEPDGTGVLVDPDLTPALVPGRSLSGVLPRLGGLAVLEPGIARGEPAGRASDVWSLGATLHLVLAGRPILGEPPADSMSAVVAHLHAAVPHVDQRLAPDLATVITAATAVERGERFPTALTFAEALREAAP